MTALEDAAKAVTEAAERLARRGAYTAVPPSTDPIVVQRRADRAAERIDAVAGLIAAGEIDARNGATIAEATAYWIRHLSITYADITAAREERARARATIRARIDPKEPTP